VNLRFNETERYGRDCFDQFFNSMGILNDFVEARLIRFGDIRSFVGYHVKVMRRNGGVFEGFMRTYDYPSAIRFFERFPGA
jgi:hypothetical protein